MKRICFTFITLLIAIVSMNAQSQLDFKLIKETVENERQYFNDILAVYQNDDPMLRTDDIALVYYGQSYLPEYNGGNDANDETLKTFAAENNYNKMYATAQKILKYNPVSLNALFQVWRAADALGKPEEETTSYVKKYFNILQMITTVGDGKSSKTPFRVICPDDQDHLMYGILNIEKVYSRKLDTETLCNIITVEPSAKFQSRTMYIDVSRYLSHTAKKK